jgi:hypothetical protein
MEISVSREGISGTAKAVLSLSNIAEKHRSYNC